MKKRTYHSTLFHQAHDGVGIGQQTYGLGFNMLADIFSPVKAVGNDFISIFWRPQIRSHWKEMALTPVEGMVNFFVGVFDVAMVLKQMVFSIVSMPFALLALPVSLIYPNSVDSLVTFFRETYGLEANHPTLALGEALITAIAAPFMQLALGVMSMLYGALQVLAAPLIGVELFAYGMLKSLSALVQQYKVKKIKTRLNDNKERVVKLMEKFARSFLDDQEQEKCQKGNKQEVYRNHWEYLKNDIEHKDFQTLIKAQNAKPLVQLLTHLKQIHNEQAISPVNNEFHSCNDLFYMFKTLQLQVHQSWREPTLEVENMFKKIDAQYDFKDAVAPHVNR